jgi:hypothetical protein
VRASSLRAQGMVKMGFDLRPLLLYPRVHQFNIQFLMRELSEQQVTHTSALWDNFMANKPVT